MLIYACYLVDDHENRYKLIIWCYSKNHLLMLLHTACQIINMPSWLISNKSENLFFRILPSVCLANFMLKVFFQKPWPGPSHINEIPLCELDLTIILSLGSNYAFIYYIFLFILVLLSDFLFQECLSLSKLLKVLLKLSYSHLKI